LGRHLATAMSVSYVLSALVYWISLGFMLIG
jgi:hypothetical protein